MIFAGFSKKKKKNPKNLPTVEQIVVFSVHEMNGFKVFPITFQGGISDLWVELVLFIKRAS